MDDLIDSAYKFAQHTITCKVCSCPDKEVCPVGEKLIADFHAALNDGLNRDAIERKKC